MASSEGYHLRAVQGLDTSRDPEDSTRKALSADWKEETGTRAAKAQ
jgi:hypothetical protein